MQDTLRGHKMRATGACIGAVIGLVTVTPAAGKGSETRLSQQSRGWVPHSNNWTVPSNGRWVQHVNTPTD